MNITDKCAPCRQQGITLLELMVVIAVIAVLATIALPDFRDTIRNNEVAAQNNEIVALVNLARNEAIRRNIPAGSDGVQVDLITDANGWTGVVLIPTGAADEDRSCGVANAIRCAGSNSVQLSGDVQLEFNNRGYLNPFQPVNFSLAHKECTNDRQARQIRISGVGQIESDFTACE